ncbi:MULTISPECIES: LytR/AlgR family response regulator transcription factor [Massilia]|uniref:LytR/AlgR family response regulator transcription factor n=1 Tax=Massilia orientalis TaxID=3050128 RepID=A0ACC7MB16_9BURK|nr:MULTISPECIES: LytTR family DNA-binding domain-containing protein [Telluria group]KQY05838.1 two-component system response regulator [Massilia sp. Root133]KQZ52289.1 two-component system response regulator [Massilia sp. Root1485]MDN4042183.1 LytTR family DNA-binding domain-containing protein [Massilia sp. YIM B02787]
MLAYLEEQLATAWPELRIVGRAGNGIEALRLVDELTPDILFLDIQMPGLNGLDLAARLVDEKNAPRVVFTTAHEAYALQAFEHAAFDYLLKPIRLERLQRTVVRLKETLSAPAPAAPSADMLAGLLRQLGMAPAAPAAAPAQAAPLQWIRAAQGQETRLIAIDEVIYFQSNDKYTSVFVADGEHLIRTPMRQLRDQLDPQQFWQIHRGVIVAARHVAGTRTDFRGRLLVKLKGRDEQLVVSRNYADLFRQM